VTRGDDAPSEEDASLPFVRREAFEEEITWCFEDNVRDLCNISIGYVDQKRPELTP
jgi:hypothetical protein